MLYFSWNTLFFFSTLLMQTQLIHNCAVETPRLEQYSPDGGKPEQTLLESFPITVGRNETADLHIPSSRVSREHALIVKRGSIYRLEDLGSTNGTFLNGKQIEEAVLHDGDLVAFADVEFSFFSGSSAASRQTATQVIDLAIGEGQDDLDPRSTLQEVRRLHEVLIHRGFVHAYHPVVDLVDGRVAGYEAVEDGSVLPSRATVAPAAAECRLMSRLRWLSRILAVEGASDQPLETYLLIPLDASDLGAEGLTESLEQLAAAFGEDRRLFVQVPENAVSDSSYFQEFCSRLREANVSIAYGGFASGSPRIGQLRRNPPELLKLAPALTQGLTRRPRQRSQLEEIVRAATDIGAIVVASGIGSGDDADLCRRAGCRFAQGSFADLSESAFPAATDRDAGDIKSIERG